MTTNELKLAKAFRDAGIEQGKAEAISQTIFDAIRENVATKTDLKILEQSLKIWTGGVAVAAGGLLFAALHYWPPHIS